MARFNHRKIADRFAKIMERAGASAVMHEAGTGTVYVTVGATFKARFADHGECYCRENISVDPTGCTLEQAVRSAAKEMDLDVARSLAAFKGAATRAAKADAAREASVAAMRSERERAVDAWRSFQAAYIAANYPDYADASSKRQKRIRAKANKAYEAQRSV